MINKKLKITVTKILTERHKYYRIDKIEGKFEKELPKYYLEPENGEPMIYCSFIEKNLYIIGLLCYCQSDIKKYNLWTVKNNNVILYEGQLVEEEYFNNCIKYLKLCSDRLSKIIDIIDISSWKGKQEFIF